MNHSFYLNNQLAWYHDEGNESGYFHTYDALTLDRNAPRKVHVFLPRNYNFEGDPYPVVYMNDGNTAFWPDGLSPYSWEVPKVLGELYRHNKIPPIIIVAIHPLNRSHEYLHVKEFSAPFKKEGGGLPKYADYLVQLKDFIDRAYHTRKDRTATTIIGSSHGGLAAFYTGCIHGQYFGQIGALSPSFWVGGVLNLRRTPLIAAVDRYLQSNNPYRPKIWLDWGCKRSGGFHNFVIERQATKWAKTMVELLQEDYRYTLGVNLFQHSDLIGGHDEQAWAYRLGLILEQFYE